MCVVPGCGRADTRPYLRGHLCPDHAPHVPVPPPWEGTRTRPVAGTESAAAPVPPSDTPTAPATPAAAALVARVQGAAARAPRHATDPYVRPGMTPTSQAAAIRALPRSGTDRRRILDALAELHGKGFAGATDVQLAKRLGMSGNSVRPRRGELVSMGLVEDTGTVKYHEGNAHTVWRVTNAAVVGLRRA